jgi:hypothetical protein
MLARRRGDPTASTHLPVSSRKWRLDRARKQPLAPRSQPPPTPASGSSRTDESRSFARRGTLPPVRRRRPQLDATLTPGRLGATVLRTPRRATRSFEGDAARAVGAGPHPRLIIRRRSGRPDRGGSSWGGPSVGAPSHRRANRTGPVSKPHQSSTWCEGCVGSDCLHPSHAGCELGGRRSSVS